MKKLMRLLAMTLAAAMLLSVGALAAENEGGGPRLVWNWLDWNEEGAYASDDALSGRSYGDEEMHMAAGDDFAVIFFTIGEDGKRTPVIPKAGKGVTIEKLAKEEIASGAKQSRYYVHVHLDDWTDTELTSGKAAMKVVAELPDVGFYTTAEAAQKGFLRNDQQPCDPAQLADNTVYFVSAPQDEYSRRVTGVKKSSNGDSGMYDLEKAGDNAWKITLKIPEDGGARINLEVTFQDPDGRTYTEERGYGFEYPQGIGLLADWLSWDDDPQPGGNPYGGNIDVIPYGEEYHLAFYFCEKEGDEPTPVPLDKLEVSKGVNVTPVVPGEAGKSHYGIITVDGWGDYTISYKGDSITLKSRLPGVGMFSKPEVSVDNFVHKLRYNPLHTYDTVYVGVNPSEGDDRVLESMELADFENKGQYALERYNDDFYKLTQKSIMIPDGDVLFNVTWKHADGSTETTTEGVWSERWPNALVSEKPVAGLPTLDDMVSYDGIKSQLSDKVTLKAGETKTVYLALTYCMEDEWVVYGGYPFMFSASSSDLKLTFAGDGKDIVKYTLSCDVPGEYTIGVCGMRFTILDEKGNDITDSFEYGLDYDFETSEWIVVKWDEATESVVPVDLDQKLTITCKSGEDRGWFPITVTVTGEAPKPAFPDVAATAWYAPAVTFANSNGYMNGNADGTFNPDGQIKGSEFAQILYNKEGKPAAADGASFNGVTTQWYAPAILWAAGKGIVTDTGDAAIAPEANLTRQQIALMLYNYMDKPAVTADLSGFADADQISGWAREAMEWAVSVGVLKGSDNGGVLSLNPTGTATRAQAAQILMNFFG